MITDYCTIRKKVPGFPGPIAKKWCFPRTFPGPIKFQDFSRFSRFSRTAGHPDRHKQEATVICCSEHRLLKHTTASSDINSLKA